MGRKEAVKGQKLQDKVAELYESIGYETETNVAMPYKNGHYFIDVVAKKWPRTVYTECKNYDGRIGLGEPSKFKNVVSLMGLERGLFKRSVFVYRGEPQLGSDDIGLKLVSFDNLEKKIKRVKRMRRLRNVFFIGRCKFRCLLLSGSV